MPSTALTALITFTAVTLANLLGLRLTISLYQNAHISFYGLEISWLLIAFIPGSLGGIAVILLGRRSGYWWWIFLPGILIWMLRPWRLGPWDWEIKGAVQFLMNYGQWLARNYQDAPPQAFAGLVGTTVVASLCAAISGQSIRQTRRHIRGGLRDGRRSAKSGGGGKGAMPQASWASAREVRDRFNHDGGIVLGEHTNPIEDTPAFDPGKAPRSWWRATGGRQGRGHLITMNPADGNGHVLVLAASAGYKTSGIVIPNILNYDGPLVVFDPKGDLYARTKEARREMGYDAVVIDAQNGFDPFKMIAPLAREVPSVYHTMAKTLMPLNSKSSEVSEFFHDMSVSLFAALTAHFIVENETNVARAISKFINRKRDVVIAEAQKIVLQHDLPFITDEMNGLSAIDERTFPGLVKGISNKLSFIQFPDIANYAASERTPEEHLAALNPKTDIFISIPSLAAKDFSPFPRLLIGSMFVVSELLEQPDRPRARRLFLVDEARVLGGMDVLNNVRDAGRSIGMHLMLIYQNLGQVNEAWGGQAGADAWLDSCEARVVSAVGSSRTAADISAMLGKRTIRVTTEGSSSQNQVMSPMGGSVGASESEQLRDVPLMTQAALGQLPAHGSIIFTRRSRPILATKAIFFTRDDMQDRVKSPESVQDDLDVTRRRKAVLKRIKDKATKTPSRTNTEPAPADVAKAAPPHSNEAATNRPDAVLTAQAVPAGKAQRAEGQNPAASGPEAQAGASVKYPKIRCHEGPPIMGLPEPLIQEINTWLSVTQKRETDLPFMAWLARRANTTPPPAEPSNTTRQAEAHPTFHAQNGQQSVRTQAAASPEDRTVRSSSDATPQAKTEDAGAEQKCQIPRREAGAADTAQGKDISGAPIATAQPQDSPDFALTEAEWGEIERNHWSPDLYATWGRLGVPFGDLIFARPAPRDPARMTLLRRILWRGATPARTLWTRWMQPIKDIPLNLDLDTLQLIPRPHTATDGSKIIRIFDIIDWYLSHPDGRYELYDLKCRRRQFDGLEWRLHRARCWIRNEPYGLPPGLQPSTDIPDHASLRARISPATKGFIPSNARYDPVANAVPGRWFTPGQISDVALWTSDDLGPIPTEQPPQLVFEHIPVVTLPAKQHDRDEDQAAFMRWVSDVTLQDHFVAALRGLRHPPETSSHAMAFFDAWPEIPRADAGIVSTPLLASDVPLQSWSSCIWTDRVEGQWRLFRQPISGQGYPLGAACSWPIIEGAQAWHKQPLNTAA